MSNQILSVWVVYQSPKDFPGKFVVREQRVLPDGRIAAAVAPAAVTLTLDEAREKGVPRWATRIDRHPFDDAVIVETWI